MFYVISYDIPDDPRRIKIANILEDFGDRVQYSVFECLLDQDLLEKMISRLEKVVKKDDDSVRVYALCGNCEKVIKVIGQGEVTKEEKYYIL
jgi:CRISPR-associated protein Cas2